MNNYLYNPNYRRIFLQDYSINMIIGVLEHEQQNKQIVIFNIDIFVAVNTNYAQYNDDIKEVLDYNIIIQTIDKYSLYSSYRLQETLCDRILDDLLTNVNIHAVNINMYKKNVYNNANGVGISRFKEKI